MEKIGVKMICVPLPDEIKYIASLSDVFKEPQMDIMFLNNILDMVRVSIEDNSLLSSRMIKICLEYGIVFDDNVVVLNHLLEGIRKIMVWLLANDVLDELVVIKYTDKSIITNKKD